MLPSVCLCGGQGWYVEDLPLEHPYFGKAQPCPVCTAPKLSQTKLSRHFSEAGLHADLFQRMTFETYHLRVAERLTADQRSTLELALIEARTFATRPAGFLLLTGDPGCGKTHLAAAIVHQVVSSGRSALFVSVPDLLDHLRASFREGAEDSFDQRWENVRSVDVLALDDFGAQSDTPWAREKLYQLVNHRLVNGLPLVITSNWTLPEFAPYHARIASRLRSATHVHITAPDARGIDA